MDRRWIVSSFFIAFLLLVCVQVVWIFTPFLQPIFWAMVLAFTFYPVYKFFLNKFRLGSNASALLVALIIVLITVPFLTIVTFKLTKELTSFVQEVIVFTKSGGFDSLASDLRAVPWIARLETEFLKTDTIVNQLSDYVVSGAKDIGNIAINQVGRVTKNVIAFFFGFVIMLILIFVFLIDGKRIYDFIRLISPLDTKDKNEVFHQIEETFSAVIRGQIITALVQACIAGIAFHVLDLPFPVIGGCLTFLLSMVPILGASSVWVPYFLYLLISKVFLQAFLLLAIGVFVISMIDNLLKPALIGKKTKLPYFLLFFVILGGLAVYGLPGIFLGPIIISIFFVLVRIYLEKYQIREEQSS